MKRLIIGALLVSGCASAPDTAETKQDKEADHLGKSAAKMFFQNSVRRDATAEEASRVAYVTNIGCTAFFVENTQSKTYVMSARHCFDHAITAWCNKGGEIADTNGVTGQCTRIVAADASHDVALFESNLAHASNGSSTLRLVGYAPSVNTPLVMIGYPYDFDPQTARKGALTTTDHCWALSSSVASPYTESSELDWSAMHNCTTYGGNSGGPMYIEGQRDVVGLPFTYMPNDYSRRSPTSLSTAAYMALVADFVGVHRSELDAAGVVISE
jgi:hypothetical protein